MKNTWIENSNIYRIQEISQHIKMLPVAVYKLEFNDMAGFYLVRIQDKFDFPYKIYGMEDKFVNRVLRTYSTTKSNLGVLLNGIKGTGKTVTAKMICNKLNLPIILINHNYDDIISYLNNIQQDVILMFDEYEKTFGEEDNTLLTLMDGVLDNGFRKTFILTTNELYINDNLLQRPSRVRYLKTYKDLPLETIEEIVDDKLKYPEFKNQILKFISTLETITIDIVKSVVDEVNIHNEAPDNFSDVFNTTPSVNNWNIYEKIKGKWKLIMSEIKMNDNGLFFPLDSATDEGRMISQNDGKNKIYGRIYSVIDDYEIILEDLNKSVTPSISSNKTSSNTKKVKQQKRKLRTLKFERTYSKHKYFKKYVF